MGTRLTKAAADTIFQSLARKYDVFAPVLKVGEGCFSDTDIVRYEKVSSLDEIEWNKKSDYSFKEVLLSINETLFYFTEDQTMVPNGPKKDILVFVRACDLHAVRRLDQIYLDNKFEDFYYARIRNRVKFILMGCASTCDTGFCVSMGTNKAEGYAAYIKVDGDQVFTDVRLDELNCLEAGETVDVTPDFVTENKEKVALPKNPAAISKDDEIWKEYGSRCINCGRCNFACPTCTCFTMQDIFYQDNAKVGERRRVWTSCQLEDYDTIAGGIKFRRSNADRLRFKVMHKIYDFEKRFGYTMCVGCGRCDNICPEYISYSTLVNKLAAKEEA